MVGPSLAFAWPLHGFCMASAEDSAEGLCIYEFLHSLIVCLLSPVFILTNSRCLRLSLLGLLAWTSPNSVAYTRPFINTRRPPIPSTWHRPSRLTHLRPSTHIHIHHVRIKIEKRERVSGPLQERECFEAQVEHYKTHKTAFFQPIVEESREAGPAGSTSFPGSFVKRHIAIVGKVSTHRYLNLHTVTDRL